LLQFIFTQIKPTAEVAWVFLYGGLSIVAFWFLVGFTQILSMVLTLDRVECFEDYRAELLKRWPDLDAEYLKRWPDVEQNQGEPAHG
jgi:hypothetical protein